MIAYKIRLYQRKCNTSFFYQWFCVQQHQIPRRKATTWDTWNRQGIEFNTLLYILCQEGIETIFFQSYPTGWTVYAIGTLLNEVLYMALSSFGNHLRLYFVNYTLVHKFTFIHPIDPLISHSASRSVDTFTNDA